MRRIDGFELPCYDHHKSFYGRAVVKEYDDEAELFSYGTKVARIKNGEFHQIWNRWSATTQRHIDSFRVHYGLPPRPITSVKRRFIDKWFSGNEKGYRKVRKEHCNRVLRKWKQFLAEEKECGNITVKQYNNLIDKF